MFRSEVFKNFPDKYNHSSDDSLFSALDERRKAYEESQYSRWYCVREILYSQYLWDMRCWHKPKYEYTHEEIKEHILRWLNNHVGNNCGHCLYCIRRLLTHKWATLDEVAGLVKRNPYICYPYEIGSWEKDNINNENQAGQISEGPVLNQYRLREE